MKNIYQWPLWHWHFEITSACTLKCPRCSRTELPEQLVISSLNLDFFKKNFTQDIVAQMKRITFCGYDGDPIYNKEFIEICAYFKQIKPDLELYIVTNGSYKSSDWWMSLGSVLNEYDQIHFSLDGWDQASNEKYRINSNWQSILDGIETLRSEPVRLVWDMIYFDFNYKKHELMTDMAKKLGFDAIRKTKSNKFNFFYNSYDLDLQPPKDFISPNGRFESKTTFLTNKPIHDSSFDTALGIYSQMDTNQEIVPLCKIGTKGLFVDSQGYFYPCCWIINKYDPEHYSAWLTEDKNIKKSGLENVLNNLFWSSFLANISTMSICKSKCNSHEVNKKTIGKW